MTLREQCEAFLARHRIRTHFFQSVDDLEKFCLKQQAVGLREAAEAYAQWINGEEIGDDKFEEWCEQRAREREGL